MSMTTPNSGFPAGAKRARDGKGADWRGMLRGLLAAIMEGDDDVAANDDAGQKIGASTVFLSPANRALLIKRAAGEKNYPGHWSLPGGNGEPGEAPEETADREASEEIGQHPPGGKELLDKRTTPSGMAFHTFVKRVSDEFEPKLNAEHTDHKWSALDDLPSPIHPAVKENLGKLREKIATDGKAHDSAPPLAFDRESVRSYDVDGRLHVDRTPISKATVNGYFGREIPGAESLGLKPDQKYKLLRDPEELKKAADTFNNIPLLRRHVSVSADDHKPDDVIGSTGTDAAFNHPYLTNSLVVWSKDDIKQIEAELKKELSSAYRYRADMTPGIFEGQEYQGVMRDLVANHVAVVFAGRAGHDVVVGDSQPENTRMSTKTPLLNALKAFLGPRLATGQSVDGLEHILALDADPDIEPSAGTTADKKAKDAAEEEKKEKEAKDRKAKDAAEAEEKIKKEAADKKARDEAEEEKKAADRKARDEKKSMDRKARDAAPEGLKGWMKSKLTAEDYGKACDMLESERKADDEASAMTGMTDKDPDPENTNSKGAKDKKAMDEDTVKSLVAAERRNQQAIYEARNAVRSRVGELTIAFDSADDVYKTALEAAGVKTGGVHSSAYKAMFEMLPSRNADHGRDNRLAMDAASQSSFAKRYPGAASIRINS